MTRFVTEKEKTALRERFGVRDGQMRFPKEFKNMHLRLCDAVGADWVRFVDVDSFSYGDIDQEDLLRFMKELKPGEMIVGLWESWNFSPSGSNDEKIPDLLKDVGFIVTKDEIWSKNRPRVCLTVH